MNEREKPPVLILKTDGTNCDQETKHAYSKAGGKPEIVLLNDLKEGRRKLRDYKIFAMPGGFAYGDDVRSGKILAIDLIAYLADQMNDFVYRDKGLILGICNGDQALTRAGLSPFGTIGEMQATLKDNDSGRFGRRTINLRIEKNNACVFMKDMKGPVSYQVAHGEGKFYAEPSQLKRIEDNNLVVFRYCDALGNPTQEYPQNPNGSLNAIAGVTDLSGQILVLMPHPERSVDKTQYENWRRMGDFKPEGLEFFERMIEYASQM